MRRKFLAALAAILCLSSIASATHPVAVRARIVTPHVSTIAVAPVFSQVYAQPVFAQPVLQVAQPVCHVQQVQQVYAQPVVQAAFVQQSFAVQHVQAVRAVRVQQVQAVAPAVQVNVFQRRGLFR